MRGFHPFCSEFDALQEFPFGFHHHTPAERMVWIVRSCPVMREGETNKCPLNKGQCHEKEEEEEQKCDAKKGREGKCPMKEEEQGKCPAKMEQIGKCPLMNEQQIEPSTNQEQGKCPVKKDEKGQCPMKKEQQENSVLHKVCMMRPQSKQQLELIKTDKELCVTVDLSQFEPEEITVRVVDGNMVVIEGKHEQKDENGVVSQHLLRKFRLAKNADIDNITSSISPDGTLSVKIPKREKEEVTERVVPIKKVDPQSEREETEKSKL